MLLPLLIGFGLLAALLLSDGKKRRDDTREIPRIED